MLACTHRKVSLLGMVHILTVNNPMLLVVESRCLSPQPVCLRIVEDVVVAGLGHVLVLEINGDEPKSPRRMMLVHRITF